MTNKRPRPEASRACAAGAAFVAGAALLLSLGFSLSILDAPALRHAVHRSQTIRRAVPAPSASTPSSAIAVTPRADAQLDRTASSRVGPGSLFVPASFQSADGTFDLLVFFHGNAELVAQSAAAAKLNALVLVVNVGIGSGAYESHYALPAIVTFELDRVVQAIAARGLVGARMGRLALGAWSAGYGALLRILAFDAIRPRVSAVLLADALHSNLKDGPGRIVDLERIAPIVQFAREAAAGDKLFVMTHSEVNEFRYATTTETSNALIDVVGTYRSRSADWPDRPLFPLARQVMSTDRWLEQRSEAHKGQFHVRGYRGYQEDDHIAHLAQISSTLFAELVTYWSPLKPKRRR